MPLQDVTRCHFCPTQEKSAWPTCQNFEEAIKVFKKSSSAPTKQDKNIAMPTFVAPMDNRTSNCLEINASYVSYL